MTSLPSLQTVLEHLKELFFSPVFFFLFLSLSLSLFFFFFLVSLGPHPWQMEVPRLGSQIRPIAAGLYHRHGNSGPNLRPQPTPQLMAMPGP